MPPESFCRTRGIGDEDDRSSALAALAPYLGPEQLDEALAAAMAIDNVYYCSNALAALAPYFGPEQRPIMLGKALAAAKAIGDEAYQVHDARVLESGRSGSA